jgi:ATP-binding cassette subfamily B protein
MMSPARGMGLGMGRGFRSFLKDESVKREKLPQGLVKRVLKFALPYRRILTVYFVVLILDAIVGVSNPLIYRVILNNGILHKDVRLILVLAGILAGLAVIDGVFSLIQRYVSAKVGEGLIYDMREKVFGHIQKMPVAFFMRTQTGALVSRLNNDVLGAQQAFTDTLSSVVGNLVTVIFTIGAMALLSWQITLAALLLLPVFLIPARRVGRRLQKLTRNAYNLNAEMNNTMTEKFNVSGAILVKLFGNFAKEHENFKNKAGRVRDIGVQTAIYGRIFFVSLSMTSSLATALVYGWGGTLAADRILNVGTVVALASLLNRLYGPLTSLSNMNVDIMTALVSFDRVFEVLDLKPMISEKPDAIEIPRGQVSVEFKNVSFAYPTAEEVSLASLESVALLDQTPSGEVLHNISFCINPGEMYALVGPSGAGKTTISYLVPRLYDATSGSVLLAGINVKDAKISSIKNIVGMVTQEAHLFHDTIRSNLLYAKPDASETELYEVLKEAQIYDLISQLPDKLDTVVGDRGYRLSGGEKQRIAIARLLLKAPDVVVLDEATAHLDSESERAIQKAFNRALAGRTSLVIAHRLSTVRDADKILVINRGSIVESGVHEELLANEGLYAELYLTQFAKQEKASQ